jgi:hypothetical protein
MTDPDCSMQQQANGETNPGYSVTTAVDGKNDFITHFQVNDGSNDAQALLEAAGGSENNTGFRHKTLVADAGFSSMENLEKLALMGQDALIPDRRMNIETRGETAKGEYDRSRFRYFQRDDCFVCPKKKHLLRKGTVTREGREYGRYVNPAACKQCSQKSLCTKSSYRMIVRDTKEYLREAMRKKLTSKKQKRRYGKRAHSAESPYAQIKHNLKYRIFMRRGKGKVTMEIALLFMLHNIMKIGAGRMQPA